MDNKLRFLTRKNIFALHMKTPKNASIAFTWNIRISMPKRHRKHIIELLNAKFSVSQPPSKKTHMQNASWEQIKLY